MKALIVTTQSEYNYGAVLQAYAFHEFLLENGVEHAFLLDNKLEFHVYEKFKSLSRSSFINLYFNFRKFFVKKELLIKAARFDRFINSVFPFDVSSNYRSYDLFVTGGDQMFNRACLSQPNNFLSFSGEKSKKVSFSTSFGSSVFSEEEREAIIKQLNGYSCVSLRENVGFLSREKGFFAPLRKDLDCSFLLPAESYDKIAAFDEAKYPKEYVLVYELMSHKDVNKALRTIQKEYGLPVVYINCGHFRLRKRGINVFDAGPEEFLGLIKHAKFVLTTSFHGTCFSIIYKKPFLTLVQPYEKRIPALLEEFGLSKNCFVDFPSSAELPIPDFTLACQKIKDGADLAHSYVTKWREFY